jgi:3-hydroxyacyl-CoA dehydrogenase
MTDHIAIVGSGLVGRSWSIVFARAGLEVSIWDPVEGAAEAALAWIDATLPELQAFGLLQDAGTDQVRQRLRAVGSLAAALEGATHVQESAPERVEVKRALYLELDRLAAPDAVLASSTSGIPASSFTDGLEGRQRCLVAHPINPPHLVPLVEIVPAPWTEADAVDRTRELMRAIGQSPIELSREVAGFVVNRLQGALLAEAFRLVEDGVCSVDDVDAAIADGLGLRWSFMGPFETIDLNSPAGVRGYCDMLGALYYALAEEQADPRRWEAPLVGRIEGERRARLDLERLPERQLWRDKRLAMLIRAKREAAEVLGA